MLRLERGKATAQLERERRKARQVAGTTVVLSDLEPDVLRVLTQRKVVDYLRARRGPALRGGRGPFSRSREPGETGGDEAGDSATSHAMGAHRVLALRLPTRLPRRVAVVGRAGTTIVDDIAEIEEFALAPWDSGQVTGEVVFAALQQTAGRRAVLRDRDAFPVFVDGVKAVEPAVRRAAEKLVHEVDAQAADRLAETLRRIFGRVLKELADLDNPMRTPVGNEPGEGGLFEPARAEGTGPSRNGSAECSSGCGATFPSGGKAGLSEPSSDEARS